MEGIPSGVYQIEKFAQGSQRVVSIPRIASRMGRFPRKGDFVGTQGIGLRIGAAYAA